MLILTLLAACCLPFGADEGASPDAAAGHSPAPVAALPPPPSTLGAPDASQAAKPRWADHDGYAPQADAALIDLGTPVQGEARDGLVACRVTSYVREARLRKVAANPDLEATLSFGDLSIFAANPDNVATMTISAPLATLMPGDILRIAVKDRQLLRRRKLGTLETGYVKLPAEMDLESLRGTCVWVDRDTVEAQASAPLQQARRAVSAWEPAPSLRDESLAPSGAGATASQAMHAAAALVGWADPRLQTLVRPYDEAWDDHHRQLAAAVGELAPDLETGWTTVGADLRWAPAELIAGGNLDLGLANTDWGLLLPLQTEEALSPFSDMIGDLAQLELVDSEGAHWSLGVSGTLDSAGKFDLAGTVQGSGKVVLSGGSKAHRDAPVLPAILRAHTEKGWVFQRVADAR